MKMDNNRSMYGRRKGIQMSNILGDPFALATISIALVRNSSNYVIGLLLTSVSLRGSLPLFLPSLRV